MQAIIAEASKSYSRLIEATLALYGFNSTTVGSGAALLEALDGGNHQLLVVSTSIVDYDVCDLVQLIRQKVRDPRLSLMVLSSREDEALMHALLGLGANNYFLKREFSEFELSVSKLAEEKNQANLLCGTILYVEDTRSVADATRALLQDAGHQVVWFDTGEAALEAFLQQHFDLVLADQNLAGSLNGLNLLRKIRGLEDVEKALTPVIAVSAYGDDAKRIQLFQAGVSDYVTKPVLNLELLARVQVHIRNQVLMVQLRENQAQLKTLALCDQLTGLYNRHFLTSAVEKSIAAAVRHDHPLTLMVLDLDHFKRINDQHGHHVGDQVLKITASTICEQARANDIVARYGGEEIVLVLDHCQLVDAVSLGERLLTAIADSKPAGLSVTASIGIAQWLKDESFDQWFVRADAAVYEAKNAGRNRLATATGTLSN